MTRAQATLAVVLIAGLLLWVQGGRPPYDDAFFFLRFARHTIEHGMPAWNLSDGPVYGNTSQLHQGIATVVLGITRTHGLSVLRGMAVLWLALAAWALGRAPEQRGPALIALLGPVGIATVTTGMETAMTIGLGSLFVAEWQRVHTERDGVLAILGILLVTARPDMALLVGGSLVLRVHTRGRLEAVVAWALGCACLLVVWAALYGSPVPTAFATKAGWSALYDDSFIAACRAAKARHVGLFMLCIAPLVARWRREHWPLAAASVAFVGYHLVGNLDVMGMHARYYAPALPWIVAAGAGGQWPRPTWLGAWAVVGLAAVLGGAVPSSAGWQLGQVAPGAYVALALAAAAVAWSRPAWAAVALAGGILSAPAPASPWRSDDALARALQADVSSFRGLNAVVDCLPPDITVFHSEIGVVGQRLPHATVVDLGGLMRPAVAPDALDALCADLQPDAVWLPHRNYRTAQQALLRGSCLQGYSQVSKRSSSPLYVRSDHMGKWRRCATTR